MIRASGVNKAVQEIVRDRVCTRCYKRPIDSEVFPPTQARECERGCAVFENLEGVERIVDDAESDMSLDYEAQVQAHVCTRCKLSATAGAYCHRRIQQTCPLSLYADRVVRAIEPLVLQHCGCD